MNRDLRNLIVSVLFALVLSSLVWYFAQHWLTWAGVRYDGTPGLTAALLAYLPGWALLLEHLLPGLVVGLMASRWRVIAGALTTYVFALSLACFAYLSNHFSYSGFAEIALGKALTSSVYGAISALAGRSLRAQFSAVNGSTPAR